MGMPTLLSFNLMLFISNKLLQASSRGSHIWLIYHFIQALWIQPADKYPSIFSENSLFGRFPYLLPCLLISLFAAGILVACIWLPETLHMHNGKASSNKLEETGDMVKIEGRRTSNGNLFKNWPLMSTIFVYCVFSLHEIAYTEIFSLWAVSDRKYGGLSFSSQEVGEVLAISGFGLLLFQLLLYQPVEKLVGPIMVTRLAAILSIPLLSSFPYMAKLSGITLQLIINCASILKNALSVSIVTGLIILQNNAVPQHQRGAANGISMTAMSVFKSFGPAGGGALFSWAQRRQVADFLPGDQMVFFALNLILLIGLLLTFKPFLAQPD